MGELLLFRNSERPIFCETPRAFGVHEKKKKKKRSFFGGFFGRFVKSRFPSDLVAQPPTPPSSDCSHPDNTGEQQEYPPLADGIP